jgi:Alpha/beta hydrolase domain
MKQLSVRPSGAGDRPKARGVMRFRVAGSLLAMLLALAGLPGLVFSVESASATVASPSVSGPVGGGTPSEWMFSTSFNLAQVGYQEKEFFISGTAKSYTSSQLLTTDGKWNNIVPTGTTAPYTTRVVVRTPIDPAKFNGTVIVEWLNVSGGVDAGPDWTLSHNELIRDGFAWVGVSAQWLGVQAAQGNNPLVVPGDPARYGALSHPGDSFSYDIFSQAGQAIRHNAALMLGGLIPNKLIAVGESQSAGRLVTYINAIQPRDHEYDGFLVHSRGATGAPLQQTAPGQRQCAGGHDFPQ